MKYPWWMRPIVSPFLNETKSLKKHIDGLEAFLGPVLKVGGLLAPGVSIMTAIGAFEINTRSYFQETQRLHSVVGGEGG
jgi:hypothetical protein